MSLKPDPIQPVPEETARVARAAFRKGNPLLKLRDELGAIFADADFADLFPRLGQPGAESGVRRNIPGRCGNAPAGNRNPGWGDVGRDASDFGGERAAGRVEGRGAELAGDRAAARPGGVDDQPRTTSERAARGRPPAGPRRGLLPRAPAATGRPRT